MMKRTWFCGVGTFSKGKNASACIGLTPIQHSSGGEVKLGAYFGENNPELAEKWVIEFDRSRHWVR